MNQFNLGWIPLIQQELRKFFASKGQGDKADTALQPGAIGTTVQGYDADLAAIAALTTTGIIDRTGAGTAATRATGATGLSVLAAADAATARTAIGAMANTAPEIITNANGTAYRWPNGLQICAHATGISFSTVSAYDYLWTFPAAFTTLLGLSGLIRAAENGVDIRNGLVYHSRTDSSPTVGAFHVRTTGGLGTPTNFNFIQPRVLAIGTYTP